MRIGLPSGPSASSPNASAYLRPSWKMWPISIARSISSGGAAARARIAGGDVGRLDVAVDGEVAADDGVDDVVLVLLAPVTQAVPATTRGSTRYAHAVRRPCRSAET